MWTCLDASWPLLRIEDTQDPSHFLASGEEQNRNGEKSLQSTAKRANRANWMDSACIFLLVCRLAGAIAVRPRTGPQNHHPLQIEGLSFTSKLVSATNEMTESGCTAIYFIIISSDVFELLLDALLGRHGRFVCVNCEYSPFAVCRVNRAMFWR